MDGPASRPPRGARLFTEALARALADEGRVSAAILFGSQATGRARPTSDFDIGVLLSTPVAPEERGELTRQLIAAIAQTLASDRIHLVLLDDAPPALAFQVARDGLVALCRDRARLLRFKTRAYKLHGDYVQAEELFRQATRRRWLGEARGG